MENSMVVPQKIKNRITGASLVAQWLRICLPMQGTHRFEPWSGKIPRAVEQLGPWATITEPVRLEPVLRNKRGRDSERPVHRDEEWPPVAATRESPRTETKTQHSDKLKKKKKNYWLIQQCHSWVYIQTKWNQYLEEIYLHSYTHYSIINNSQDMETA